MAICTASRISARATPRRANSDCNRGLRSIATCTARPPVIGSVNQARMVVSSWPAPFLSQASGGAPLAARALLIAGVSSLGSVVTQPASIAMAPAASIAQPVRLGARPPSKWGG